MLHSTPELAERPPSCAGRGRPSPVPNSARLGVRGPTGALRVLHVGKYFPPHLGGMETYLADLVAAQRGMGLDAAAIVHGAALPDDPEWLTRVPTAGRLLYAPVAPGFRGALKRVIARHRPDVLHLHMPNTSAFWTLTLGVAREIPWVVHWHSDVVASRIRTALAPAYRAYRPFEQALLAHARRIVATSQPYVEASAALAAWRDKVSIVPLGLNVERLPRDPQPAGALPWSEGAFRLLSVGRLTYYKGFETLIRAVATLPGVELAIVGEGELRGPLESLIAARTPSGTRPRIRLLGGVSDAHKCAFLNACDAFCLASRERTEAFGIVLLEAMAYGKPCLVSDLPGSGMPWLVKRTGAGGAIPVDDEGAWRNAIERLRTDRAAAERFGAAGAESLLREFTVARSADALAPVYEAALPTRGLDPVGDRLLIVIPARNEAATIQSVVMSLRDLGWNNLLVVDDQSSDDTARLAAEAGAVVLRPVLPMGAWGAMQTGIRYALRHGYGRVVTIDADGQHEPAFIPVLLEKAASHDVVIGAFPERGSRLRKIAWRYFRLITGFGIEDLTSGFRYFGREACEILAGEEATLLDYQDLGVLLLLRHNGLSIAEVPVEMYPRSAGCSRIFTSWSRVARYMAESTLLCLARWHPKHHLVQ